MDIVYVIWVMWSIVKWERFIMVKLFDIDE